MDKRSSFDTLEKKQNTITNKLAEIKARIRANKGKKPDTRRIDVRAMADEYEEAMARYTRKPRRYFKENILPETRSWIMLERAVSFARELDVDFATYIKGIFYFADMVWNKPPTTREISDYKTKIPAKARVQRYLDDIGSGKTKKSTKIVSLVQTIDVPQSVKSKNSERQLKTFMKNYNMSEEQIFRKFAKGTDSVLYFDRNWLKTQPTYIALLEAGEV